MVAEVTEKIVLDSEGAAYEDPGEQAIMGSVASGGEYHESINASHCLDHKHTSFTRHN